MQLSSDKTAAWTEELLHEFMAGASGAATTELQGDSPAGILRS